MMQSHDCFSVDNHEDMIAVGHCPSPPTTPSSRVNTLNDATFQPDIESFDHEYFNNEGSITDRMVDPPSKICGGAVFSKLRSIGNGNHKKKKKIKEQRREEKDDNSSTMMSLLRNKVTKKKENKDIAIKKDVTEKQRTVTVSESTTVSSISEPTASVSFVPRTVEYGPSMKSSKSGDRLDKDSGREQMVSFQDFQVLLNEIKVLNETVKENSMLTKPSKSNASDADCDHSNHSKTQIVPYGKKRDEESLDGLVFVESNDDKENSSTIERLNTERKLYRLEADALRSELGGIKDELSELRKFLQQRPTSVNENESCTAIFHYGNDNPPSLEEGRAHRESETTLQVLINGSSSVNREKKVSSIGQDEVKDFATSPKLHDGAVHTKYGNVFSNLEDREDEYNLKDHDLHQHPIKLQRSGPVNVGAETRSTSSGMPSSEQSNNNNSGNKSGDSDTKKYHHDACQTRSSSEKTYYDMIYEAVPGRIENQCIDISQSIDDNFKQNGNGNFRHQIICDTGQLNLSCKEEERVLVKSNSMSKAKNGPRTSGGRSVNPMRQRSGLYPPSPSIAKLHVTNTNAGRRINLSKQNKRSSDIANFDKDWTASHHQTNRSVDSGVNNDDVVESRQSMSSEHEHNDSTEEEFDFETARNFYRKFENLHQPDLAKRSENSSSKPENSQQNPPFGEDGYSSNNNHTKKQDYDLIAADRKYRELFRASPKRGDKNDGDNLQHSGSRSHRLDNTTADSSSAVWSFDDSISSSSPQRPPLAPF
eukprot:jgi/Psemu1/68639/estExt_Genemark1.C_5540008